MARESRAGRPWSGLGPAAPTEVFRRAGRGLTWRHRARGPVRAPAVPGRDPPTSAGTTFGGAVGRVGAVGGGAAVAHHLACDGRGRAVAVHPKNDIKHFPRLTASERCRPTS